MNADTRFLNTEKKIRDAFLELLQKVGFQKITVRMLIEKAGINRSTFYLHYEDKYALLEAVEQDLMDEVRECFEATIQEQFPDPNAANFHDALSRATDFIEVHKPLFVLLASPKGDPAFMGKYAERVWNMLVANHIIQVENPLTATYMKAGFEGAVSSMFSTWIQRGFSESPEEYFTVVRNVLAETGTIAAMVAGLPPLIEE